MTISQPATATNSGTSLLVYLVGIYKEGWHYLWIRTQKVKDSTIGVEVDVPDSAHVERFYDYEDFTRLEIFDKIDGFNDDIEDELDEEEDDEIAGGLSANVPA